MSGALTSMSLQMVVPVLQKLLANGHATMRTPWTSARVRGASARVRPPLPKIMTAQPPERPVCAIGASGVSQST